MPYLALMVSKEILSMTIDLFMDKLISLQLVQLAFMLCCARYICKGFYLVLGCRNMQNLVTKNLDKWS